MAANLPDPAAERTWILLGRMAGGDPAAGDAVYDLVHSDLHDRAERLMRRQMPGHTLQPTALVHEAWLRLTGARQAGWNDRKHFLRVATRAMRHVLIDRARARQAAKRAGVQQPHEDMEVSCEDRTWRLLVLNDALEELRKHDERLFRVAELRLFGGLDHAEIAKVLEVSTRTAIRAWRSAQSWLSQRLGDRQDD